MSRSVAVYPAGPRMTEEHVAERRGSDAATKTRRHAVTEYLHGGRRPAADLFGFCPLGLSCRYGCRNAEHQRLTLG